MVKGEFSGKGILRKDPDLFGVILGLEGPARRTGDIDGGDVVLSRIPSGVRIGMELFDKLYFKACLLPGLPDCRLLQTLTIIAISPGDGPLSGLIQAQDQDNPPFLLDDDIYSGRGITEFLDHCITLGAPKPVFIFCHLHHHKCPSAGLKQVNLEIGL